MSAQWEPEVGQSYWCVQYTGQPVCFQWMNTDFQKMQLDIGNVFKTQTEAEQACDLFKNALLYLKASNNSVAINALMTATPKQDAPKMTAEVFNHPDCPSWAQYAMVNALGYGYWYEKHPDLFYAGHGHGARVRFIGCFDSVDWQNSLIERPDKLPDWCKVDAICWHKRCGYFKVIYIDDVSKCVDIQQVEDNSKGYLSFHTVCNETVQAHLRPYSAEGMQGLIGKVVSNERGDMFLVTAFVAADGGGVCVDGVVYDANDLFECYTINGRPCGVLGHLNEKGE